jgi:cytochrome c556
MCPQIQSRNGKTCVRLRPSLALLLISLAAANVQAAPPKFARPPQFSKSISDVFFPDANAKLVGPRPEKATAGPLAAASTTDSPSTGANQPGGAWSNLIAAEVVEDEIKLQQLKLGETLKSASKFKERDHVKARLHLSLLATMFGIDAAYDGSMRWKREASGLRDVTARAGFNCKVGTDASFKEAKARWEDLQTLIRGGSVSTPNATEDWQWSQISERSLLMKRLDQAHEKGLVPGSANAAEFSRQLQSLSHEAQIIAALAEIIEKTGYEFADDETYRGYAESMKTEALAVRDAVEQKNYEEARRAVGEISKSCSKCHEGFRN